MKPSIDENDAQIIAEYRIRVLMDQDLAQVAYLKVFQPLGTSYNPLRSVNKLNRHNIEFPVSILCGSNDRGGHGGCEEIVKINQFFT